jgi:hypothetical protein
MRVVMTNTAKGGFHSGQDIIRGVSDDIEKRDKNSDIQNGLKGELGDEFKLWAEVVITPPSEQDRIRYENFIMGYIHRHDQDKDQGQPQDHSVYFKWDKTRGDGSLLGRVFVSPLLVAHYSTLDPAPAESAIGDAATDPPGSTTPPPPMQGVASSSQ